MTPMRVTAFRSRCLLAGGLAWAIFVLCAPAPGAADSDSNKPPIDLLSKADAEAILGVTIQPPKAYKPFRSLLDPDFTEGTIDQGCKFTNEVSGRPGPKHVVGVGVEVRYSDVRDPMAIETAQKQVDERTREHPVDVPDLGDAAFSIGPDNFPSLFVFRGGTMRLMIGPSEIGLEKEKAIAAKIMEKLGKPTGYVYGTPPAGLIKPVLNEPAANASEVDQMIRALTTKADRDDRAAQVALGKLYEVGTPTADGSPQPNYRAAAYWYYQAATHKTPEAAYRLSSLLKSGKGLEQDEKKAFQFLRAAADGGYVPAMSQLSGVYAQQKTAMSTERATYWATTAANAGDPRGWLILGYECQKGMLGGDPPFWAAQAMVYYKKSAEGGNATAMLEVGQMYADGIGVPRDQAEAQKWFAKAEAKAGQDLDHLRQQAAAYREKATAHHLPAFPPTVLVPLNPRLHPIDALHNGRSSEKQAEGERQLLAALVGTALFIAAVDFLSEYTEDAVEQRRADDFSQTVDDINNFLGNKSLVP